MSRIYTMGEILVEIMRDRPDIPLDNPGVFLGPYPSGAPAIFISAAARTGAETRIWGGVGQDRFGSLLLERLGRDGVDCSGITVEEGLSTAAAFVSYDSAGEREFIFHIDGTPAGNARFPRDGEKKDGIPVPDWFHVMGCSLMVNSSLREEILKACSYFHSRGASVSFDPNIRPELLGNRSVGEVTGPVMERCRVFFPGREELALYSKEKDTAFCAAELFSRYPAMEIIVVKKGALGAEIHTREGKEEIPATFLDEKDVLDPTGAGDTFDGVFLSLLARGFSPSQACRIAADAGARNTAAFGPMEGDLAGL